MTQLEKLHKRICSRPKDFTWEELVRLLKAHGYDELTGGKTGGSRRRFFNPATQLVITLHKPHPGNILKEYQLKEIIAHLGICR
ncbi:type II toxin-antitoxin system HicA family toxin [Hymenobacter psychrotolerans]|uniref:HicA toxin of toxin-antitoxin n=1 Tax=Hymenobacter psychrotolerans DSM 18569 TaxID=1121959 RepID=A0A1M7D151_9BACT|nr:type II toxin-antitoxin system HicA family toxin [Hymenobacter psychrotolerans]SHL73216.1 HicA toxin of toxin-antitoxin [Hymenobacter psychrotolerans DSM 18569]